MMTAQGKHSTMAHLRDFWGHLTGSGAQALRNAMGLGNTLGALPVSCGGTGLTASPTWSTTTFYSTTTWNGLTITVTTTGDVTVTGRIAKYGNLIIVSQIKIVYAAQITGTASVSFSGKTRVADIGLFRALHSGDYGDTVGEYTYNTISLNRTYADTGTYSASFMGAFIFM